MAYIKNKKKEVTSSVSRRGDLILGDKVYIYDHGEKVEATVKYIMNNTKTKTTSVLVTLDGKMFDMKTGLSDDPEIYII